MKVSLRCVLALSLFAIAAAPAHAQTAGSDRSSVFLELAGNGLYYTVNYEFRVGHFLSTRAGFSFFNVTPASESAGAFDQKVAVGLLPIMVNGLFGFAGDSHYLEVGAGPLFGLAGTGVSEVEAAGRRIEVGDFVLSGYTSAIGYRYQRPRGGLLLRATATPFYSAGEAQLWGGISLGLSH